MINRGDFDNSRNLSTRSLRIAANIVTVSASTLTLGIFSQSNQMFNGSVGGQVVDLGDATGYEVSHLYFLFNDSVTSIKVQDNTGATLFHLFPKQRANVALRSNATAAGIWHYHLEYELKQDVISTTDATVTSGELISIPTDTTVMITTEVLAKRTGGTAGTVGDAASYVRQARFTNVAGVVRIFNSQTQFTSEDVGGWDAHLAVSGTNANVSVKGAANTNVSWHISTRIQII